MVRLKSTPARHSSFVPVKHDVSMHDQDNRISCRLHALNMLVENRPLRSLILNHPAVSSFDDEELLNVIASIRQDDGQRNNDPIY